MYERERIVAGTCTWGVGCWLLWMVGGLAWVWLRIMGDSRVIISAVEGEFARYRMLAEKAAGRLSFEQMRVALDPQVNSVAVIMKHVGGNLRSRWTDALTSDGEKPWRDRDGEFFDDFTSREEIEAAWKGGWDVLEAAVKGWTDDDLGRVVMIRKEPHSLMMALQRSVTHCAYHSGQIVQTARVIASRAGVDWEALTIARGGSAAFNAGKGMGGNEASR